MIDENAFGLLIAYFSLEDDEYAGEREDFVERYAAFARIVRERLAEHPPGGGGHAVDLGHALYLELLEDHEPSDLIGWLKATRSALAEQDYRTAGILSFGSSWVDTEAPRSETVQVGKLTLTRVSLPSEPLRRALLAEAATHGDEETGVEGWGPGLYLDIEAVEALGKKPKNEPTVLRTSGVRFFRAGS
jgi:hypothetical protein